MCIIKSIIGFGFRDSENYESFDRFLLSASVSGFGQITQTSALIILSIMFNFIEHLLTYGNRTEWSHERAAGVPFV